MKIKFQQLILRLVNRMMEKDKNFRTEIQNSIELIEAFESIEVSKS
jgi:hypothetical protein